MTIDSLKRQVNAAVTPLVSTAGKCGDYAYVHINLSKGSSIMGFFPLEGDIDFDSIAAQAKSAESEGRENTLFIFAGTDIPEWAWSNVYSKGFQQNKCESIVIPQGVTKIGYCAFSGCSALTSVEIPNSVTEIGENAFSSCSSLISVEIPNSVTEIGGDTFYNCSGLTSVEIPNSVTSIGGSAFKGCSALTSVEIPNSVTEIGDSAFYGCKGLTSVEIPNSVTEIGDSAFEGCTSLTFTGKFASDDHLCLIVNGILNSFIYTGQTSYSIPNSVSMIGKSAFKGCTGLTSVEIPNSVTSIGASAFEGCTGLTSAEIPNSVTEIGGSAFKGCTGLTRVEIPNSVTEIGWSAFYGCSGLTSVKIPNSVTKIGRLAFQDCTGLTTVEIPNSVTEIGENAFSRCTGLTSVEIPNSVTVIGKSAFYGCSALTSVEIPNSVTNIGYSAFLNCSSITTVTLHEGIINVDGLAFANCDTLQQVSIANKDMTIGIDAFSRCPQLSIVDLPKGLSWSKVKNKFKDTPWGTNGPENSKTAERKAKEEAEKAKEEKLGALLDMTVEAMARTTFAPYETNVTIGETTMKVNVALANNSFIVGSFRIDKKKDYKQIDWDALQAFKAVAESKAATLYVVGDIVEENVSSDCKDLTSVEITNSVTEIGHSAFEDCKGLTSVTIGSSVTEIGYCAFNGCTGLTSVEIPNSVTSIGASAFEGCTGLTSVEIPNSVTSIGGSAFKGCTGLTSVKIPNSVTEIGKSVFEGCTGLKSVEIPNSVTKIRKFVFEGCTGLTSVEIPNSVTEIGGGVFSDCTGLTSVEIPNSVTEIGGFAFEGCTGLTSVEIPNSVTKIRWSVFKGCTSLVSVKIPNSVTEIGESAFEGCTGLTSVEIPNSVTEIDRSAFIGTTISFDNEHYSLSDGILVNKDTKTLLKYIGNATEVTVPDGIEIIGYDAFENNATLQSITLPASVMSIETMFDTYNEHTAFDNCTALHTVVIGNPYVNIDLKAFRGCKAITNVDLPAGLTWTKIKNRFKECPWGQNKPTIPAKKAAPKAKTAGGKAEKDLRSMSITAAVKYILEPYKANVSIKNLRSYGENHYYLNITVPLQGNSIIYGLLGNADGRAFSDRKITINQIDIESLKAIKLQVEQEQLADTIYYIGNVYVNSNEVFNATQAKQLIVTPRALKVRFEDCPTLERVVVTGVDSPQGDCLLNFKSCTALKDVVLAEGVRSIWYSAFEGCTALESIDLPKSVVCIDLRAFKGCTALKTINMPGVKELSDDVFYGCTALKFTLPSCLEKISAFSFNGLDLNECEFENEHFVMRNGMLISKAENMMVAQYAHRMSATSVTIPEGVTAISYKGFSGCATLTSVTLPESLQEIGSYSFEKTALHSIVIPEAVTEIGDFAFFECTDLKKVVIQNPNTTFGEGAFGNCTALTEVELPKGMTWSKMKKYFKGSPWSKEKPKK